MRISASSLLTTILLCATSSGISTAAIGDCPDGRDGWSDADIIVVLRFDDQVGIGLSNDEGSTRVEWERLAFTVEEPLLGPLESGAAGTLRIRPERIERVRSHLPEGSDLSLSGTRHLAFLYEVDGAYALDQCATGLVPELTGTPPTYLWPSGAVRERWPDFFEGRRSREAVVLTLGEVRELVGDYTWESQRSPGPDYPPRFLLDFGVGYGWGIRRVVPDDLRPLVGPDGEEESWRSGGLVQARALYRLGEAYVGPTFSVWWSRHSLPEPPGDTVNAIWVFGGLTVQRVPPPTGWAAGMSLGFSRLHQYDSFRDLDGFTVRPFVGRQFQVGRQTVLTPAVGAWFTVPFKESLTMPSMLTFSVSIGWWGYQTKGHRLQESGGPE